LRKFARLPSAKIGFANPEWVNLNDYHYGVIHKDELNHDVEIFANYRNLYCYGKAIEDGKIQANPK